MLFDQGRELPVATVRRAPRSKLAMLAGDLSRWLSARWDWLRPRTVPMIVAFVGMLAVLQAASYLSGPAPEDASDARALASPGTLIVVETVPARAGEPVWTVLDCEYPAPSAP